MNTENTFLFESEEMRLAKAAEQYRLANTKLPAGITNLEPINFGASRRDYQHGGATASLDRIDSSLGYTPGNLQWVHKDVNKMKMDLPQQCFLELCQLISKMPPM